MKWILRIGIGLVLLLVIAVACVMFFVGDIIKTAVETVAPDVIGAPVTVESVSVHPLAGTATIKGLVVGNPEGFNSASAFEMDRLHVSLDMGSLTSDKVIVKEILISGPRITYEGSLRGSNIGRILKNVEGDGGDEEAPAEEPAEEAATDGKQVQIDLVLIEEGSVKLALKELGGRGATLPLPKVELRDIGKGDSNVTLGEAVARIVRALATSVVNVVKGSSEMLKKGTEALNKGVGAAAGALGAAAGDATGAAGAAVENAAGAAGAAMQGAAGAAGDAVKGVAGAAGGAAKGVAGAAGGAAKGVAGAAGGAVKGIGSAAGKLGEGAGKGASAVGGAAASAAGTATEGVKDAGKAIGAGAAKLGGGVKGLFGGKKEDAEEVPDDE